MQTLRDVLLISILPFLFLWQAAAQTALDRYVAEGLKSNLALQQKSISTETARSGLRIATSNFLPSISAEASYTDSKGGRSIAIPVGDLLNPVYRTLNQLTGSSSFPLVENAKEYFFPSKFYDAKVHVTMPLLNTDIILNRNIQSDYVRLSEYERDMYKRELVQEIKVVYFDYLSALEAVSIYRSAIEVAMEAKRVNESLVRNGAGLTVYLLRAEGELASLNGSVQQAEGNVSDARKYFNFLLNRDADGFIDTTLGSSDVDVLPDTAMTRPREEIGALQQALLISSSIAAMKSLYWVPKISGFFDLGAQGTDWEHTSDSNYRLFGIQLSFPIFEGFRNRNAMEEANLSQRIAELRLEETRQRLSMLQSVRRNELETARKNYTAALAQLRSAESYYKLVAKGYEQGANSFIETVDARNQLTTSRLLAAVDKYRTLQAKARYERETATDPITSY